MQLAALLFLMMMPTFNTAVLTIPSGLLEVKDEKAQWIEELHACENFENVKRILDSNDKYSYGYLMFQMDTWLSYGKKFGATKDNIGNAELQKKVARSMLDSGEWWHWKNCVTKKVRPKLGEYPVQ